MSAQQPLSLLALPRELRDEIWKNVVGNKQINISARTILKPREGLSDQIARMVLTQKTPWRAPFKTLVIEQVSVTNQIASNEILFAYKMDNQAEAQENLPSSAVKPDQHLDCLSMNLLQTNRQIYNEASSFFHTSNVFSFTEGRQFRTWVRKLSTQQRARVKAIGVAYIRGWHNHSYIPVPSLDQLPSLESVHLNVKRHGPNGPSLIEMEDAVLHQLGYLSLLFVTKGKKLKRIPISVEIINDTVEAEDTKWTSDEQEAFKVWVDKCREEALEYINKGDQRWPTRVQNLRQREEAEGF